MEKIILENFEPFRDMFFTSCKYTSCLTLAGYYRKNVLPILTNPIFNYEFNEESNIFKANVTEIKEIYRVLMEMGISIHLKWPGVDNLKDEILNSLSNGHPVSISIDMYYQPGRPIYYNKIHGPGHQVLVFGYDPDIDTFYTVDDMNGMNVYPISHNDLQNCYNGMLESGGIEPGKKCAFFEFGLNLNICSTEKGSSIYFCIADFIDNMLSNKDLIVKSLENVRAFEEAFDRLYRNEAILNNLRSTKDCRLSESYRFLRLLEFFKSDSDVFRFYSEIDTLGKEIEDHFIQIRNISARDIYTNEFNIETRNKSKGLINEIYNKEVQLYDILYSIIAKWKEAEWYTSLRQEVPA